MNLLCYLISYWLSYCEQPNGVHIPFLQCWLIKVLIEKGVVSRHMILLYLQNCQNVNITQIRDTWTFFMDLSLKNDDHPVILQNNRSCPQSKHLAISALGVLHNSLKYIFFIRIGREFTCIFYWNYWTWEIY